MTDSATLSLRRRIFRVTAFRAGLLIGGLLTSSVLLIASAFDLDEHEVQRFEEKVTTVGGDLDRHHVARIAIRDPRRAEIGVGQRCRGGCDDLWVNGRTMVGYHIEVRNSQDGVIAKNSPRWGGDWIVRGADVLTASEIR